MTNNQIISQAINAEIKLTRSGDRDLAATLRTDRLILQTAVQHKDFTRAAKQAIEVCRVAKMYGVAIQ